MKSDATNEQDVAAGEEPEQAIESEPVGVGEQMRVRRIEKGWSVKAVAEELRLRERQITAIENDQPEFLPGGVYTLGFVRSYAQILGLDPDPIVALARLQWWGVQKHTDSRSNSANVAKNEQGRRLSIRPSWLLWISVGALCIGLLAWAVSDLDRLKRLTDQLELELGLDDVQRIITGAPKEIAGAATTKPVAGVDGKPIGSVVEPSVLGSDANKPEFVIASPQTEPATPEPNVTEVKPVVPTPESTDSAVAESRSIESLSTEFPPVEAPQVESPPVVDAITVPEVRADEDGEPEDQTTNNSPAANGVPIAFPEEPGTDYFQEVASQPGLITGTSPVLFVSDSVDEPDHTGRIVFRALAESWVEITETASDRKTWTGILREGQQLIILNSDGLRLRTGSAGALEIAIDGVIMPPLGRLGSVRSNVQLDPDWLRNRLQVEVPGPGAVVTNQVDASGTVPVVTAPEPDPNSPGQRLNDLRPGSRIVLPNLNLTRQ